MAMEDHTVSDFNGLLAAARQAREKFGRQSPILFRGQECADPSWRLVPRVFREGYRAWAENMMIEEFRREARSRHSTCPPSQDAAGWLSLMQHYGLPTRLLDWTRSIAVAAFFAVAYKEHNGPAAVWALCPNRLNPDVAGDQPALAHLSSPAALRQFPYGLRRYVLQGNAEQGEDGIVACAGQEVDARMMLQQAAYTVHGSETPLEEYANSRKFLVKFVIRETAKAGIKEALALLGIRLSYLFPDLGNLARCIAGRWNATEPSTPNGGL